MTFSTARLDYYILDQDNADNSWDPFQNRLNILRADYPVGSLLMTALSVDLIKVELGADVYRQRLLASRAFLF